MTQGDDHQGRQAAGADPGAAAVPAAAQAHPAPPVDAAGRQTVLADLSPGYFGLVMATGIISLAAHMMAWPVVAEALFRLNVLQYGVLWVLYAWRAWRYPRRFFGDLVDHLQGPGFFTLIAGTGVLASQFIVLRADLVLGVALWALCLLLWVALTYAVFLAFTIKPSKPALDRGIHGGWLLAVVAAQSVAVCSVLLAEPASPWRAGLDFLALSMWLWGGMLYIWMIALIFYRTTFFRLLPGELVPPYWINMGAMAISTLAGALLIGNSEQAPVLAAMQPFLKGFTVLYWATGTWWIPMLLLLGVWRHGAQRFPLRYDPQYWGAVFPLGMYAACTHEMTRVLPVAFLSGLARVFLWAAMAAWLLCFGGMLHAAIRTLWAARRGSGGR